MSFLIHNSHKSFQYKTFNNKAFNNNNLFNKTMDSKIYNNLTPIILILI
jgi:hypothetical protein